MRRAVATVLTILLPATVWAQSAPPPLPAEFAGKQHAVMQAMFPKWDEATASTGVAGQHARIADSRLLEMTGRHVIALLVETWQGDACRGASCPPAPLDVGLVELSGGKMQLIAAAHSVAKSGAPLRAWLDTTPRQFDAKTPLVGVDLVQTQPETVVLHLFRVDGAVMLPVFERHILWQRADTKCESTVVSDVVDGAPYPLKVVDTCKPSGRSAIEVWRWPATTEAGSAYQLHGPESDADRPDLTLEENQ